VLNKAQPENNPDRGCELKDEGHRDVKTLDSHEIQGLDKKKTDDSICKKPRKFLFFSF